MSFSVDLWNGINLIKNQYYSTQKKIKSFFKLVNSYITIESNYCKNLETLYKEYKEYKDNISPESLLDESFQKIIEIFDYENKNRQIFYTNLIKIIVEPLNAYLEKPKIKLNKCFSDNTENTENFKKSLGLLIEKQSLFHTQCRELSSYIALMEIDEINKTNKISKSKFQKTLDKVNSAKEDYLNYMKEANKQRENYNLKTEEILSSLEAMYKEMVEKLKESLFTFASYRLEFLKCLIGKEQKEFDNIHSKVDPNQEIINFIMKNATKEFPMVKFEFCPIKYSSLNNYIKNKYSKFNEKDYPPIYKAIKKYFDSNNIFKDDSVTRVNRKSNDFFGRRFTFFQKKNASIDNNQNEITKENKVFIENYFTDLFMNKNIENKNINNKKQNKKEDVKEETKEKNTEKNIEKKDTPDTPTTIDENNSNEIKKKRVILKLLMKIL